MKNTVSDVFYSITDLKIIGLILLFLLSGCSSFNVAKGGVQVSSNSSQIDYTPYLSDGAFCIKGNGFNICHKRNLSLGNSYLRIEQHNINIRIQCERVTPDGSLKCITDTQIAGPLGINKSKGLYSLDSSLRTWSADKCSFLKINGQSSSCNEIQAYIDDYHDKKTKERFAKIAEKERLQAKLKREREKRIDTCKRDTKALHQTLKEGDRTTLGLVVEVKSNIALIQKSAEMHWYKIEILRALSCASTY